MSIPKRVLEGGRPAACLSKSRRGRDPRTGRMGAPRAVKTGLHTASIRGEFGAATSQDDPINGSRTGRPAESGRAGAVGKDKHTLSEHGPDRSILDPRRRRRNQFGEKRGSEIHFGQRRGQTPQAARLPDSGQGHEWVRLYGAAILGRGDRRSGVLEPWNPVTDLLQCAGGTDVSAPDNRKG